MTVGILAGVGKALRLVEILHGDHAAEFKIVVHHQQFFDAVAVQFLLYFGEFRALFHRYQLVLCGHDLRHTFLRVRLKAHVAAGDNPHQVAAIQYGHTGYAVGAGKFDQLGDSGRLLDSDWILDHAAFELLDLAHLLRLLGDAHALVDNADPAFLRHGDGQAEFSHCIHGG